MSRTKSIDQDGNLTCTRCKQAKPTSDYRRRASASSGFSYYCKRCSTENNREWIASLPEERKAERLARQRDYIHAWRLRKATNSKVLEQADSSWLHNGITSEPAEIDELRELRDAFMQMFDRLAFVLERAVTSRLICGHPK